jgi:hypothetical protein
MLKPNWKQVVRKAWSIRLVALSCVFTAAEVVVPMYSDAFPRNTFALLSAFTAIGALVARVLMQNNLDD